MKDHMNSWNERKQVHDEVITWARHDQLVKILWSVHKSWFKGHDKNMGNLWSSLVVLSNQMVKRRLIQTNKNDVIHTKRKVANL